MTPIKFMGGMRLEQHSWSRVVYDAQATFPHTRRAANCTFALVWLYPLRSRADVEQISESRRRDLVTDAALRSPRELAVHEVQRRPRGRRALPGKGGFGRRVLPPSRPDAHVVDVDTDRTPDRDQVLIDPGPRMSENRSSTSPTERRSMPDETSLAAFTEAFRRAREVRRSSTEGPCLAPGQASSHDVRDASRRSARSWLFASSGHW